MSGLRKSVLGFGVFLAVIICLCQGLLAGEQTWRLDESGQLQQLRTGSEDNYLLAVAELKRAVSRGKSRDVKKAAERIKKDFPEVAGEDFDAYIKAEVLLSEGKLTKAARQYDKMLDDYPESGFRDAAMARQFEIGAEFLGGRKRTLLMVFRVRGYAEGVKIMEKLTDRAGNTELAKRAAVAVARHYEARRKHEQAYLKWQEISSRWPTGDIGKEALLGMATSKYAAYRGRQYDASGLISARSYYENFKLRYPDEAEKEGVDDMLKHIDEQLAEKQLSIARYYDNTGSEQQANLYYQMVIDQWLDTKQAEVAAKQMKRAEPKEEKGTWLKTIEKLFL